MNQKMDKLPTTAVFLFAAIGSAVGLGNIWRFPYLVGKYGGAEFLIPYFLLLVVVGVPLLILELALGQRLHRGPVSVFKSIMPPLGGIGVAASLAGCLIAIYYAVVVAWSLMMLFSSFGSGWQVDPASFFFREVLHSSSSPNHFYLISTLLLFALVICWICVYLFLWRGVRNSSVLVAVIMPIPFLLLFIILLNGLSYPGAWEGIVYYLKPSVETLYDAEVWVAAMTQVFFSLSLGLGIMITFGNYELTHKEVVRCACLVALADGLVALLSGLVVFVTIGHMASSGGLSIEDLAASGPTLSFIVFAKALSLLPGAPFFAFIFFLILFVLGLNGLASLVEAVALAVREHFPSISKATISLYVCIFCCLGGLIYTTGAGLYFLDTVDHFVTTFSLLTVGLAQALVVGWLPRALEFQKWVHSISQWKVGRLWLWSIKYISPAILTILLAFSFYHESKHLYASYPLWVVFTFGWGAVALTYLGWGLYAIYATENRRNVTELFYPD